MLFIYFCQTNLKILITKLVTVCNRRPFPLSNAVWELWLFGKVSANEIWQFEVEFAVSFVDLINCTQCHVTMFLHNIHEITLFLATVYNWIV